MGSPAPGSAVITGAPGAGKSTLLAALGARGFTTVGEVARTLLRAPGGMEKRESDPVGFAFDMLDAQISAYSACAIGVRRPVIFDRGFADIAGFLDVSGLEPVMAVEVTCAVMRFDGPIFRAPPWREIFAPDEERTQNWEEAVASDAAICAAWARHGYDLVDLPLSSVEERVAIVIGQIALP